MSRLAALADVQAQNVTLALPKGVLTRVKVLAAERGTSISAVIVFDLFFTLMKTFSIMPVMPSASVIDVRPAIRSGRPTAAPSIRSKATSWPPESTTATDIAIIHRGRLKARARPERRPGRRTRASPSAPR